MTESLKKDKQRLIETALELYSRYGLRSVTMDELCRELGMSKKTLYQIVADKSELIISVLDYEKELQSGITEEMIVTGMNAIDELIHVNRHIHTSQKLHSPTFYFDLKKLYPQLYAEWIDFKRQLMNELLIRNLNKGIKEGLYRQDMNVEVISKLHLARAEVLHSSDLIDDEEYTTKGFIDEVFRYHIHGICNDQGLSYFKKRMNEIETQ